MIDLIKLYMQNKESCIKEKIRLDNYRFISGFIYKNKVYYFWNVDSEHSEVFDLIFGMDDFDNHIYKHDLITFRQDGAKTADKRMSINSFWIRVKKLDRKTIERIGNWISTLPERFKKHAVLIDISPITKFAAEKTVRLKTLSEKSLYNILAR